MRGAKPVLVGVDTPFLVAYSVIEHPEHEQARCRCGQLVEKNHLLALCPTVIDEFIHVVTDARRFERPLDMVQALELAQNWLNSRETVSLFPCEQSTRLQLHWLRTHRLGRKRINDTRIASIYYQNGAHTLLTGNVRDYTVFDCFKIIQL
ncbi:MAG: type II toxin-antitoxin system VapC family toxin [Opitutales bacterium]